MSANNQMQVGVLVALQEVEVREEFLKQRTLLLAQHVAMLKEEQKSLLGRISGLDADLRVARGEIDGASE
ncbi:hypothetical protein [Agrobacterium burrii]|uniref:Uncharacterized protein n=1 Tax=Agrobacterium burrii TaxID=2815339 RepID=A0ABS3EB67_9HYPH|nr:hypothetical protein [Agrobacterium burrii]MBO0129189.1 hypothetical protein [Agrobacterium burrii]